MNKYVQMADRLYDQEQQMKRLEEENTELKEVHESDKRSLALIAKKGAELEKKISILLSCKNCPNNKGGYICQKEYEDKCLSQKIQYIKELQEENNYLSEQIQKLKIELDTPESVVLDKLDEAKEIIKLLLGDLRNRSYEPVKDLEQAEQFLKECE